MSPSDDLLPEIQPTLEEAHDNLLDEYEKCFKELLQKSGRGSLLLDKHVDVLTRNAHPALADAAAHELPYMGKEWASESQQLQQKLLPSAHVSFERLSIGARIEAWLLQPSTTAASREQPLQQALLQKNIPSEGQTTHLKPTHAFNQLFHECLETRERQLAQLLGRRDLSGSGGELSLGEKLTAFEAALYDLTQLLDQRFSKSIISASYATSVYSQNRFASNPEEAAKMMDVLRNLFAPERAQCIESYAEADKLTKEIEAERERWGRGKTGRSPAEELIVESGSKVATPPPPQKTRGFAPSPPHEDIEPKPTSSPPRVSYHPVEPLAHRLGNLLPPHSKQAAIIEHYARSVVQPIQGAAHKEGGTTIWGMLQTAQIPRQQQKELNLFMTGNAAKAQSRIDTVCRPSEELTKTWEKLHKDIKENYKAHLQANRTDAPIPPLVEERIAVLHASVYATAFSVLTKIILPLLNKENFPLKAVDLDAIKPYLVELIANKIFENLDFAKKEKAMLESNKDREVIDKRYRAT